MKPDAPIILSREKLANALGISLRNLDRKVTAGEIPSFLIGQRRMFDLTDVLAALKSKGGK